MKPNRYLIFVSMEVELVGLTLGTLYVGNILDQLWHTKGLVTVATLVLGFVGWFFHLIFLLKRIEKLESKDRNQS